MELCNQFLIHRAPGIQIEKGVLIFVDPPLVVDQLNLLVRPIVSNAVVDNHVEAIPSASHVDGQGDGIPHMDGSRDPGSSEPVAGADLHEALGRRKCEDHRVGSVSSACEVGEGTWKDTRFNTEERKSKVLASSRMKFQRSLFIHCSVVLHICRFIRKDRKGKRRRTEYSSCDVGEEGE